MAPLPVRAVVRDPDLQRSRLTVFFRLLLAIPHLIWLGIFGFGVAILAVVNWFVVLFKRESPTNLHRVLAQYVNYATHVYAYVSIAANRFPGFLGQPGYEVDIQIDDPRPQS